MCQVVICEGAALIDQEVLQRRPVAVENRLPLGAAGGMSDIRREFHEPVVGGVWGAGDLVGDDAQCRRLAELQFGSADRRAERCGVTLRLDSGKKRIGLGIDLADFLDLGVQVSLQGILRIENREDLLASD